MSSLRQHIAIILVALFMMPIVYQPLHKMLHHDHHGIEVVGDGVVLTDSETHCAICDYDFATLFFNHKEVALSKPYQYFIATSVDVKGQLSGFEGYCIILRGPPSL